MDWRRLAPGCYQIFHLTISKSTQPHLSEDHPRWNMLQLCQAINYSLLCGMASWVVFSYFLCNHDQGLSEWWELNISLLNSRLAVYTADEENMVFLVIQSRCIFILAKLWWLAEVVLTSIVGSIELYGDFLSIVEKSSKTVIKSYVRCDCDSLTDSDITFFWDLLWL